MIIWDKLIFSSWMTQSCHGLLLEALEWHSITHSLTHSLTHSILINLFIKVRLNTLPLPPLLSITFVPSAFYAYVWHILEGTSKAPFFLDTVQSPKKRDNLTTELQQRKELGGFHRLKAFRVGQGLGVYSILGYLMSGIQYFYA